jgi:protein-tyrosine phosphatase
MLGIRQLPMEGQRNFRDLGGYKTKDGKVVKWGTVFRSGKCNLFTDSDLEYLTSASLKTIIDFRSESEKAAEPDRVPATVTLQQAFPIDAANLGGGIDINTVLASGDIEAAKQYLVVANQAFITSFQNEYKQFFATLQVGNNLPLMFHCTAGKDRAGLAAALFLSSLDVDRQTIIEDYLLTNVCSNVTLENIKAQYVPVMGENAAVCMYYIYSVQREYIQAAFDIIEQNYGSVENFLTQQLGVDLEKMKSLYLY